MKSRPILLRAMRARTLAPARPLFIRPPTAPLLPPSTPLRALSTSRPLYNEKPSEQEQQQQQQSTSEQQNQNQNPESKNKQKRSAGSSSGEDNAPPQSPFAVFMQVFREEIQANKGWQDDIKQLSGDVDKLADSAAMKKGRDVYERVRIANLIKNNPRLVDAAKRVAASGMSVNEAVSRALQDSVVVSTLRSSYDWSYRKTQFIRDDPTFQAIASGVEELLEDAGGGVAMGYEEKEARRKRREKRAAAAGRTASKRVQENPDAGEAVVLSDKQEAEPRLSFLKSSPTYQRLRETYYESDDPVVSTFRSVTSRVAGWFDENETAKVVRAMKEMDPDWKMDTWQRELREYIVPEVVDAYLSADNASLREWCGEAAYNVLWATMGQYVKQGLVSDSKILDINNIDVSKGAFLENDRPVFIVTFQTQELLLFRRATTGEAVVGSEDGVVSCRYAMVLTRSDKDLDNPLTGGWKVVEFARRQA